MPNTTINAAEIAEAVIQAMKEGGHVFWIDPEVHASQHEFIAELIAERHERKARRRRIEEKIAGSLILSSILTLVGFLGAGFLQWIKTY